MTRRWAFVRYTGGPEPEPAASTDRAVGIWVRGYIVPAPGGDLYAEDYRCATGASDTVRFLSSEGIWFESEIISTKGR